MIMAKTAYRGIEVPSLRNSIAYGDNAAEYALAAEDDSSLNDLLDMVPVESPNQGRPSPAQEAFMVKLINEIRVLDASLARQAEDYNARMAGRWTTGRDGNVSRWIDRLLAKRDELRKAERAKREAVSLEDGMYVLDGEIFKVQHAVHGSGKQYAKRVIPNGPGEKATFVYAPGVVTRLRPEHRMTKDQAKQWGALYGTCVRCGALLTAEDSIDRMMGPTCAGKI